MQAGKMNMGILKKEASSDMLEQNWLVLHREINERALSDGNTLRLTQATSNLVLKHRQVGRQLSHPDQAKIMN